jgi:hypothetical protein
LRIDLVGTTADYRRPGPPRPLPLNHLPGENRTTVCRIGEVGLSWTRSFTTGPNRICYSRSVRVMDAAAQGLTGVADNFADDI